MYSRLLGAKEDLTVLIKGEKMEAKHNQTPKMDNSVTASEVIPE